MNKTWISAGALGAMLAAVVCASSAAGSSRAAPSQIVFAANRSPQVNGEVYRVNSDGTRVDLSNSPALDADPTVSSDGKKVAFMSTRGGRVAVYLVEANGRARRRVSPSLWPATAHDGLAASFTWTADSRMFALAANGSNPGEGGLYVWGAAGWRVLVPHLTNILGATAWSQDGSMLAYTTSDTTVHVLSPSGTRLWSVVGDGPPAWGQAERLAVAADSTTVRVYDRSGHRLSGLRGNAFAWSPSGTVLAVVNGKRLQLRRGGIGTPFLDVRLARSAAANMTFNYGIRWVGDSRIEINGDNGWIGYDVAHKRLWPLPAAVANYNGVFLSDGSVAHWQQPRPGLPVTRLWVQAPGAPARPLVTATICGDEYPVWTQAVPHARAVVYQSACSNPSADLYAVSSDGSGLRELTTTTTDERLPSVSPDGRSIVYVEQQFAERCDGCPSMLWRVSSAGGTPVQLTRHTYQEEAPFDTSPSWSPDGSQIAFLRSGTNSPPTLFSMPTGGGAGARNLNVEGWEPVWGPKKIAYVTNTVKPTVNTFDPASGAAQAVAKAGVGGPLAWAHDGRLAYLKGDGRGHFSIVVVGSGAKPIALAALLTPGAEVQGLAWSPDGRRFAFTATDANGIGEVYTIGTNGKGVKQLTRDLGAVGSPSWR